MRYIFSTTDTRRYRFPTHTNLLVMDRAEATAAESFVSVMEPGESPPLHRHDDTEQVFFVLSGRGRVIVGEDERDVGEIGPGDLIRIPPGTPHRVPCVGDEPLRYLVIDCFPGGRPSAEPTWDDHVAVVCEANGWSIEDVKGA
jgi:mannose-6-phosphate isomerase-like protein (cupin superfamily)